MTGINEWRDRVHTTAVEKGWWEPQEVWVSLPEPEGHQEYGKAQRSFGDLIALVHSELSEALEEHRAGRSPEYLYYRHANGSVVNRPESYPERMVKPEGIPAELADVIIRVLDIAGYYGIDIEHAMLVKARYNESRSHRHGGKAL